MDSMYKSAVNASKKKLELHLIGIMTVTSKVEEKSSS